MAAYELYGSLADWWPLMSAPEDYAEEAGIFREALAANVDGPLRTLLELGSGGGNNASHLKRGLELTLVEPADGMRAVSAALNPECRHVAGDMRTVRLGKVFDAVLIHDAVMYMTGEDDLQAALDTAFAHCRPGGALLVVPDDTAETWTPETSWGGHDRGERSARYLAWSFDPDPRDTCFTTAYALLVRDGERPVRCVRDEHVLGLFPRETWLARLRSAGFTPRALPYRHSSFAAGAGHELFLGLRR